MGLKRFLVRKIVFSRAAFGPRQHPLGVLAHLKKEIAEAEEALSENDMQHAAEEAVDCFFLSIELLWRCVIRLTSPLMENTDDIADLSAGYIHDKLSKIESREWPDWRGLPETSFVEHVREEDFSPKHAGYTGDFCSDCGSYRMRRNGTCLLCESCGSTAGCS